jgi:hypothetical protein
MRRNLFFLFLFLPLFSFSQGFVLPSIAIPGQISEGEIKSVVLKENLLGPKRLVFFADYFQKEETSANCLDCGVDKLEVKYSGRIFSPGILEPFIFEDKSPEELRLIESLIFPLILEQPYTLYLDLSVRVMSNPISIDKSADAGVYNSKFVCKLEEI